MPGNLDTFVSCGFIKEEKADDSSLSDTALGRQSDNKHLSDAEEIASQNSIDGEFVLAEPETANLQRHTKRQRVNQNNLKAALEELKQGTLNFSQAAKKYKISATNLSVHFYRSENKNIIQSSAPGPKSIFTMEQEAFLTKYMKSRRGKQKLSYRAFRRLVWLYGEKLECKERFRSSWVNGECNHQWARAFFVRHNLNRKEAAKAKVDNKPVDDNIFREFLNSIPTKMLTNQENLKKMPQTALKEHRNLEVDTTDKNFISAHEKNKTGKNINCVIPSNLYEMENTSAHSAHTSTNELPSCSKNGKTANIFVKSEPSYNDDSFCKNNTDNLLCDETLFGTPEDEQDLPFHTEQSNTAFDKIEKELNLLQLSKFNSSFKKFTLNNQCNKCLQLFNCQEQLDLHFFDEPAHLTCKTCHTTFNNLKHLESDKRLKHLQNHCMQCDPPKPPKPTKPPRKRAKRVFPCEHCGRTWNFEKCYLRHVYDGKCEGRPAEVSDEVEGSDANKFFVCKHCSEEFKHITPFLQHLTLHE